MSAPRLDRDMLRDWVTGRSLARGVAVPVEDHGGFRVDTNGESEVCRWIFHAPLPGVAEVGRAEAKPGRFIKLCGTVDELRTVLPDAWQIEATGWFMTRTSSDNAERRLPPGYRATLTRSGPVTRAEIVAPDGDLAASGYTAETGTAFVYDRIVTAEAHRRKGLGIALMALLGAEKRQAANPDLLVATEAGKALYATLGWQTLSPYSTASVRQ